MTDVRFDGQVVIVTGAGRGMGRSHARELAARGAMVVVNDLGIGSDGGGEPDEGPASLVVEEIRAAGGAAVANADSVATAVGCKAVVEAAVESFGRVDAIIHNAGVATFIPIASMSEAEFEDVLRVHLYGAFSLTREAWPHFVAQGGGRLVYISSGAGLYGMPGLTHYGPAKTGLLALARIVSIEGAEQGIRANALAVAAMTRMMEPLFEGRPEQAEWWRENMRPEQTTPAALWLAHPDCPSAGRAYNARGGRVARVVIAESRGYRNAALTLEDVRDHFAEIEDLSEWTVPESAPELFATEAAWAEEGAGSRPAPVIPRP